MKALSLRTQETPIAQEHCERWNSWIGQKERDKVTYYKLSKRGKSLIEEVEPPSIFYDWGSRRND